MLLLLKNDDLRLRLGENGRRAATQKYNWDVVADRVIRLINERG
jgi:glycosyltransferase involved in cell wall biosynthesis